MAMFKRWLAGLLMSASTCVGTAAKGPGDGADYPLTAAKSAAALRTRGSQGLEEALRVYDALQTDLAKLKREEN